MQQDNAVVLVVLQYCLNFTDIHRGISLVYCPKIKEWLSQGIPSLQSQKAYLKRKAYSCIQETAQLKNVYLKYLNICWTEATIAMHKLKALVSVQEKLNF